MHYNFFIHLPEELNTFLVTYNHRLHKKFAASSRYAFSGLHRPHIALFFGLFQNNIELQMLDKVSQIRFRKFELCLEKLEIDLNEGYVQMHISQPDELLALHWQVIEAVNSFRGNLKRTVFSKDPALYSPSEREMLELYGSRQFGKLYNPHVSLASVGPVTAEMAEQIIDRSLEGEKFVVKSFDVIRSSDNHISADPSAELIATIKAD